MTTILKQQPDSKYYVTDGNETHYYNNLVDAKSDFNLLLSSLKREGGEWYALLCDIKDAQILSEQSE